MQILINIDNFDQNRREILRLHRSTVIVHCYRNGFGSGIPLKSRRILVHFVCLGESPCECNTSHCHCNFTNVNTGRMGHSIVGIFSQFCAVVQCDCETNICRLIGAVIDQIAQRCLINDNREFVIAIAARSNTSFIEVKCTHLCLFCCAVQTSPGVFRGAIGVRVASLFMVFTLFHDNRLGNSHVCQRD